MVPVHTIKGNAIVLKISKAALVAAALSLSALPALVAQPVLAEDSASPSKPDLGFQLSIPTITAVDSSMTEDQIRDALTGNFLDHVDDLAGLNATSITIPTISFTTTTKGAETTATYTNIVLSDVKDGVAGSVSVDKGESKSKDATFTYGKMGYEGVDIHGLFALIGLVPGDATDFAPVIAKTSSEGWSFTSPEANCQVGATEGGPMEAKPVTVLMKDVIAAGTEMSANPKDPSGAALKTIATYVTDILTSFKTSPGEFSGLDCTITNPEAAGTVHLGKLSVGGFEPGIYPAFGLEDLKIDLGEKGMVSIGKAELKTIDLNPPIEAVRADIDNLSQEWFTKNARKLVPSFAGFDISDVKVDVPDPETEGSRIQASVGDFDLTLSDYLNGIPTKISSATHGLDVPLDQGSEDQSVKMLLALGISRVNLNYELSGAWDKDAKTINFDKISISGNDLGSFAVSALLGNAGPELFDVDPNVMEAAGMGLTVKDIKLHATDDGIGEKVLPMLAAQQNSAPDAYRQQMAGIAEGTALQLLGSTDAARALGKALGDFVSGTSKSVSVDIAAKDDAGVAVPVLMQGGNDPTVLTGAFNITGSSE